MITIGKLKRNRRDDTLPITIITVFRTHTHLLLFEVACCWLVNTNCLCLFGQTEFVCYVYNFNLIVLRSIQNWLSTECQPNTLLFFSKSQDWLILIDWCQIARILCSEWNGMVLYDKSHAFFVLGPSAVRIFRNQILWHFLLDVSIISHIEPTCRNYLSVAKILALGPKDPHFQKLGLKSQEFKIF